MSIKPVVKGLYSIPLGFVNVFLIEQDGLTLIDTGISSSLKPILEAVQELGKRPSDLHSILITHLHGDHTGSLAGLKKSHRRSGVHAPGRGRADPPGDL